MSESLGTTITAIRDNLREPAGTPGSYWSDAQIVQRLNWALKQFEDTCLEHGPWFLEATVTQSLVANQYAYIFPTIAGSTIRRIRELAVYASGDDITYPPRPLQEISLPAAHQFLASPLRQSGLPAMFHSTTQASVEIRPTPNYSFTNGLIWQVYKAWTPFDVTLPNTPIPTRDLDTYHELLVLKATIKLLQMDEEAASTRYQMFMREAGERQRDLIAFLARGRRVSPTLIQVRAY